MDGVQDLFINILAAVIVFLAGVGTRGLVGFVRSWRGRAFWGRRILRGRTYLFIGAFTRFNDLEPSGFIGLGDSHAVHELATTLGRLGSSFRIAYASRISDGQLRKNLILLGLDEVNTLTPGVFEKVGSGFRVDVPTMAIEDRITGESYSAEWEVDLPHEQPTRDFDPSWFFTVGSDGVRTIRKFRADYGILIRGQNPYSLDHSLIVMAGIYGFGTWAAARLPLDSEFLSRCEGLRNFECLFKVEVQQDQIIATSIVMLRPLPTLTTRLDPPPIVRPRTSDHSERPAPCAPARNPQGSTADDVRGH